MTITAAALGKPIDMTQTVKLEYLHILTYEMRVVGEAGPHTIPVD